MKKIKVLHLIKSLGRGGAEMLLPETLTLHDKERFDFHYIYFLPWKDQMVKEIEENGGVVNCFEAKNNFQLLLNTSAIIDYCNVNEIDIIHSHLPWSGFLSRWVHRNTNIPVIYTEHNIQEKYHIATRLINKYTFNSQNLVLGVSEDVTQSIRKNIQPGIESRTLLNGVNTEKFKRSSEAGIRIRKKYGIPIDAKVIGNIAVFRKQKNLKLWVKAFKEISVENGGVYGLLVGAGPEEENIKELIADLNLENKIFLPGLQTDTISYFSAMDVFMMSSDFEGLPIALLEAMSMECVIVSTRAGGVKEVMVPPLDEFLSPPGEVGALVINVNKVLWDKEKFEQMKKTARQRVLEAFSLRNMVDSTEKIYLKYSSK
jgi:L-malate glycosyltransferase